jgi:hypothetical protein
MRIKWFMPTRYELRHPSKWIQRLRYWDTMFAFDAYAGDIQAELDEYMSNLDRGIFTDITLDGNIVDIEAPGGVDFGYVFKSELFQVDQSSFINRVDGSPWLLGYRRGFESRPFRTIDTFGPWLPTCVFSECCDAPVYLRHSFQQMRAFHWCPACESMITSVDDESIEGMNHPDFDPSLLDSKQPAE